jgi:hypothetical protein
MVSVLASRLVAAFLIVTALALTPETAAVLETRPSLTTVAPSPRFGSPPVSKQRFLDQIAADEAHARSLAQQPAPIGSPPPSDRHIDLSTYSEGIFNQFNYPCPSQFCLVTSAAQVIHGGYVIQVYAGAGRPDTAQGWLIVRILNPNHVAAPESGDYRTVLKLGALRIETITAERVGFSTVTGVSGSFNLATREFE